MKQFNIEEKKTNHQQLSELNNQFKKNFLAQDEKAHSEIIHKDSVCIDSNGSTIGRDKY